MRSVNKVILIGNVTRDPQVRQTGNGQSVCTFGLATNRSWVTSEGEQHNTAEFHELVAWSRLAEICEKYVRKGKLLYIEGYLKTRSWDTPEGVKKFKTEVVVQDLIMLEKRSGSSDNKEEFIPSEEHEEIVIKEEATEEQPEEKPEVKEEEPIKEEDPKKEPEAKEESKEEDNAEDKKTDVDMDLGL